MHSGHAFEIHDPACLRTLEKLNPSFRYSMLSACKKDSMDITEDDLKKIGQLIASVMSGNRIIITHGTDTMATTAAYLAKMNFNKTIVITGAMRPERFSNSDTDVNLGMAIAAVQVCTPGVYVCMHGMIMGTYVLLYNSTFVNNMVYRIYCCLIYCCILVILTYTT